MLVSGIDYNVYLYGKPKADGTYDGTGAIFFQNMLTPHHRLPCHPVV